MHQYGAIDAGIAQYCEAVRVRLATCADMASMRRFLLEYVDKVVYLKHTVSLHGFVPVVSEIGDDTPARKLPFCIVSEITRQERWEERMRVGEAMKYQQSLTLQRHQELSCARSRKRDQMPLRSTETPDRYSFITICGPKNSWNDMTRRNSPRNITTPQ